MRVSTDQVCAPDFPQNAEWINTVPLTLDDCISNGPVLVEFWDFARVNSLRTLAYMEQWHARYAPLGATVVGIHSPGFSVSGDDDSVRAAVERLGVKRPVLLDSHFTQWHDYGNKGWPARYLWGPKGHMRYWHYGEGDYAECEAALQDALREFGYEGDLPDVLPPIRPEDATGATMAAQTADIALPADRERVST
ncbi:MAG: redoxin domain-containing protein, partial [Thermoleophilaceae bacterium]|nr:redoxin domain-containing protein [Thermoleophilaceae bacterium]